MTRSASRSAGRAQSRRRLSPLTVVGVLLLCAGLACLGWVGYQYFGTGVTSRQAFDQERTQLRNQWQQPAEKKETDGSELDRAVPGNAIALLRIPQFGDSFEVPILEGTDLDVLARGVGHYDHTAEPGTVGNFAIAGHRITHGQPFARLLELNKGDTVIVETRSTIYTYRLDTAPRDLTVQETAGWVLDPVPGKPTAKPSKKMITLTTCQDLFHSPDRSVAFGTLAKTEKK